jgi:hypothetical protein
MRSNQLHHIYGSAFGRLAAASNYSSSNLSRGVLGSSDGYHSQAKVGAGVTASSISNGAQSARAASKPRGRGEGVKYFTLFGLG